MSPKPKAGPTQQASPAPPKAAKPRTKASRNPGPDQARTGGGKKGSIEDALKDLVALRSLLEDSEGGASVGEVQQALGRGRSVCYERRAQLNTLLGGDHDDPMVFIREGRFVLVAEAPKLVSVVEDERRALGLAQVLLEGLGMPHKAALTRLIGKLVKDPERFWAGAKGWAHLVVFSEPALCRRPTAAGPEADEALLNQLLLACQHRKAIAFGYRSLTSPDVPERRVRALGLVYSDAWFLRAWDPAKGLRMYAVDRIGEVRDTVGVLPLPESLAHFHLAENMAQAWRLVAGEAPQAVVARLPEAHALGLKHHSQELLDAEGPWRRVRYTVGDPKEMLTYLLGVGAEVLEPGWLREEARQRLQAALARYGS